jgi:hypothetical protein
MVFDRCMNTNLQVQGSQRKKKKEEDSSEETVTQDDPVSRPASFGHAQLARRKKQAADVAAAVIVVDVAGVAALVTVL